jgi:hypothetical protein
VAVQLANALLAPGQVVDFFFGGMLHGLAHLGQLGGQGLALVQRLGADFTGVVDAHQAGDVAALLLVRSASGWMMAGDGRAGWPLKGSKVRMAVSACSNKRSSGE